MHEKVKVTKHKNENITFLMQTKNLLGLISPMSISNEGHQQLKFVTNTTIIFQRVTFNMKMPRIKNEKFSFSSVAKSQSYSKRTQQRENFNFCIQNPIDVISVGMKFLPLYHTFITLMVYLFL